MCARLGLSSVFLQQNFCSDKLENLRGYPISPPRVAKLAVADVRAAR
jgi:hypothetical protein